MKLVLTTFDHDGEYRGMMLHNEAEQVFCASTGIPKDDFKACTQKQEEIGGTIYTEFHDTMRIINLIWPMQEVAP